MSENMPENVSGNTAINSLQQAVAALPLFLRTRFERRVAGLSKARVPAARRQQLVERLEQEVSAAQALQQARLATWPDIDWQDDRWVDLPVLAKRQAIEQALVSHQVVVVAGETGSGKTTQLPKICLSLGLGKNGLIGHTQPRRLAARQVAYRLAEELDSPLGDRVGYRVRFDDKSADGQLVCLLTDGMLLAEIQQDRLLSRYQVLIIDEAHERSLNIDFLLGFIKQLLPRRPDMKVIITSATIDHQRIARFFDAAIIEASGRSYPVEMVYRPADESIDVPRQVLAVVEEIEAQERAGRHGKRLDILVFLPGERDIRDTHLVLKKAELAGTDILPLYARLSAKDQARVFQPGKGRRIVLATNVAETSLTVPNVGYVIDTGTVRLSRYSVSSKVQRLPVEAVSQASANQRAGRAGRLMPGVCFRLYDQQDFLSRPAFTDPEIHRTNLASVILLMAHLRLGDIEHFPFLDRPDGRMVRDGYRLLFELGALDERQRLTPLGRGLAAFPLDPRLARMLFAAKDSLVLPQVLVMVSALAVQDPCERPPDKQSQADQAHALFRDKRSDFLFFWNLWCWSQTQRQDLSSTQYQKLLRQHYLSPRRMQEWRDIHRQLVQQVRTAGWSLPAATLMDSQPDALPSAQVDYGGIHRALLSGLATQIMRRTDEGEWQSCRNRKPVPWPGSALRRDKSPWLMAAEQIETSRLYGRVLAQIQPEWVIDAVPQLLKYEHSEPHWSKRHENAMAYESVKLFGLVLASGKRVPYEQFDKSLARVLMIREGLVEGELRQPLAFVEANRATIQQLETIEHKLRRRDYLVDEEAQAAFYDGVIPDDISNLVALRHWYKSLSGTDKARLVMPESFLLMRDVGDQANALPDTLDVDDMRFALSYHFDPSSQRDGVTVSIPQALLGVFPQWRTEWLVPGLLADKIEALLRALPKARRRQVVPVPDHARALAQKLTPTEPFLPALTRELQRMTGLRIEVEDWPVAMLSDWLVMGVRVLDGQGKVIKESIDWNEISHLAHEVESKHDDETLIVSTGDWVFGELPEQQERQLAATSVLQYPALVDEGKQVALRLLNHQADARFYHANGLTRLFVLARPDVVKPLRQQASRLPGFQKMAADKRPFARKVVDDTLFQLLRTQLAFDHVSIRSARQWQAHLTKQLGMAVPACEQRLLQFSELFAQYRQLVMRLDKLPLTFAHVHRDIGQQLDDLFHEQALRDWPDNWWQAMPRYLTTIEKRLDNLAKEDRGVIAELDECRAQYLARAVGKPFWQQPEALQLYRVMLEELRVSLFAQQLGTQMPVSFKRLNKQWLAC